MTDLVIRTGSPGSGKTTVARLVARRYPRSVRLRTDDFWHFIARGAFPPSEPGADEPNQLAADHVGCLLGVGGGRVEGVV
ncbi:hypothetical protein ACFT5B_07310 [Luteimicrobium sp. NPDC057192]|uniref:hypothetical protein n=1 Tax=Luteimicrobium sp. NPDC057192 TaxID=3346042 RepID=UPI003641EEAB